MKILARTQMLSQYNLLESLDVIKRLDFDGVEICIERKDWTMHSLEDMPVEAIRDRLVALELAPNSFSMHRDYVHDNKVFAIMKEAVRLVPKLGMDVFVFADAKAQGDDSWERMINRTQELVAIAEGEGVILAKEFEPGFIVGSTADMLRMFATIPSPNLAANLDLGHAFLLDPDPIESIHQLGEKIVHVHIEGMDASTHNHLLPQEGDMDLLAFLSALKATGFDGGMALDLYKFEYEAVAGESIAHIRALIKQI